MRRFGCRNRAVDYSSFGLIASEFHCNGFRMLMKIGTALRFIAVQGLRMLIGPIGAVVAGIAALSAAAIYVGYNFKAFKVTALNALKGLANVGIGILNSLIERFNAIAGLLGSRWKSCRRSKASGRSPMN
jgi:hypothetical protein